MTSAPLSDVARGATPTHWTRRRERGSALLLRWMSRLSLGLGRRASRGVLHGIAAYYLAFAPAARHASRAFLRRALGRSPTLAESYAHFLCFATTIHDRVFLLKERFEGIDITVEGAEHLAGLVASRQGGLLFGAHLGSFEVVGAVGRLHTGFTVAMAMYEENARKVSAMLEALAPGSAAQIVPLGRLETMLRIRELLDEGAFVGMLADRTLGDEPTQQVMLLDAPVRLPLGPMRAAALLRRPVYFMAGLQRGSSAYHVVFAPIADFSSVAAPARAAAIAAALDRYASLLDRYCRSDPCNWFNFFDVWDTGAARAAEPRSAR